jgi:hypothetical protein
VPWKLTVRSGPRVQRARFRALDEALDELERRARALTRSAQRKTLNTKVRRFEPVQQVSARIEVAGPQRLLPSTHGGVDVRGDGSTEAYVGRVRRRVVEARKGETPYAALRRALADAAGTDDRVAR